MREQPRIDGMSFFEEQSEVFLSKSRLNGFSKRRIESIEKAFLDYCLQNNYQAGARNRVMYLGSQIYCRFFENGEPVQNLLNDGIKDINKEYDAAISKYNASSRSGLEQDLVPAIWDRYGKLELYEKLKELKHDQLREKLLKESTFERISNVLGIGILEKPSQYLADRLVSDAEEYEEVATTNRIGSNSARKILLLESILASEQGGPNRTAKAKALLDMFSISQLFNFDEEVEWYLKEQLKKLDEGKVLDHDAIKAQVEAHLGTASDFYLRDLISAEVYVSNFGDNDLSKRFLSLTKSSSKENAQAFCKALITHDRWFVNGNLSIFKNQELKDILKPANVPAPVSIAVIKPVTSPKTPTKRYGISISVMALLLVITSTVAKLVDARLSWTNYFYIVCGITAVVLIAAICTFLLVSRSNKRSPDVYEANPHASTRNCSLCSLKSSQVGVDIIKRVGELIDEIRKIVDLNLRNFVLDIIDANSKGGCRLESDAEDAPDNSHLAPFLSKLRSFVESEIRNPTSRDRVGRAAPEVREIPTTITTSEEESDKPPGSFDGLQHDLETTDTLFADKVIEMLLSDLTSEIEFHNFDIAALVPPTTPFQPVT